MSDKRAIITITTSVVAIALVFGLMVGISATPTDITTQSTPLGIMGHFTITITESDGNIKSYIQTDNLNTDTVSDCIGFDLFAPFGAPNLIPDPGCGQMNDVGIGFDGVLVLDTDVQLFRETVSVRTSCTPAGTPALLPVVIGGGAVIICAAAAHTITALDIAAGVAIDAGPLTTDGPGVPALAGFVECADIAPLDGVMDSCELREVGLFDVVGPGAGNMYGRINIASLAPSTTNFVKAGDTVAATYTTTIG